MAEDLEIPEILVCCLVTELDASLAWCFDDGVEDDKDAQLAAVRTAHAGTPDSIDALAAELSDYAGLAAKYKAELAGVADFDADFIAEAQEVAKSLRARPGARDKASVETEAARVQRNRLLAVLLRRVNLVRAAARFIYRYEPTVIRKVTSAYERRRRTANRRAGEGLPGGRPRRPRRPRSRSTFGTSVTMRARALPARAH